MALESKKLALLRILQILQNYSDYDHPLTQEEIANHLSNDYGIEIERKAISRNLALLKDADIDIQSRRGDGSYIESRDFDDSELRLLIDGVLSSKYISTIHSKQLIDKLCSLSNVYFRSHVKHIYSVNDWDKTENKALFYNIELADEAINNKRRLHYDYNKYGADKKLHKSSQQNVSPYLMLVHNQRYYLMAFSEFHGNIVFHRLDRMTNMSLLDEKATLMKTVEELKNGINYKKLSSSMPYLFPDEAKTIRFKADEGIIDQIIDWFGKDIRITGNGDKTVNVEVKASPIAMEFWAMQYLNYVEILEPKELRETIKKNLQNAGKKYR